jgi:thymidine kinase
LGSLSHAFYRETLKTSIIVGRSGGMMMSIYIYKRRDQARQEKWDIIFIDEITFLKTGILFSTMTL